MADSVQGRVELTPVDSVDVQVIMDNFSDVLLRSAGPVERADLLMGDMISSDTLLAEHGLSLLVTARAGDRTSRVLLDAGHTKVGVPHNLDLLGISLEGLEAVVLSHGHMDHYGALGEVLRRVGAPLPLIVHPAAAGKKRYTKAHGATPKMFPPVPLDEFAAIGAQLLWAEGPRLGLDGLWAVSGGVARTTDFETGLPGAERDDGEGPVPDIVADDMHIVLHLAGKGLVVVSGCAHAGIINTVRHSQAITGVDKVHAVIGGFHLSGPVFEPIIGRTIEEMQKLGPELVMPMHCSGRRTQAAFEEAMGDRFVLSSVGTTVHL